MLLQMTQSFYTRLLGRQIVRNLETYTLPPPPQRLANCSGNSMPLFLFNPPKILIYKIYYESIFRGRKVDWKYFCLFLHKIGFLSITRLLRHISCKQCCRSWKIVSFISNDSWEMCICHNKCKSLLNISILCTEKNSEDDEDHTAHHRNGCLTKE